MEVSLFQLSSKNLAKGKVYIGGIPLHTLHNKMESWKGGIR